MTSIPSTPTTHIEKQAAPAPGERLDRALLYTLIALQIALLWTVQTFPSQDGPAHLNNANILRRLLIGGDALFTRYYQLNPRPENWLDHLTLAALLGLFPPVVALKLLASGYIALLPISARYAARGVNRAGGAAALLVLPLSMCLIFHKGFFGFCYSLAGFFLLIGAFIRWRDRWTIWRAMRFSLLGLLLHFAHPLSFAVACLTVAVLAIAFAITDWRATRRAHYMVNRLLLPVALLLPAVVVFVRFLLRASTERHEPFPFSSLVLYFLRLDVLPSFQAPEHAIAIGVVVFFGSVTLCAVIKRLRLKIPLTRFDALLIAILAALVLYFTTPNVSAGGSWITYRLMLYPYYLLTLWLAGQPRSGFTAWCLRGGACAFTFALIAIHAYRYQQIAPYFDEYRSAAAHLQAHRTLLPIILSDRGTGDDGEFLSRNVRLFTQASGYLAAERDLVDLSNYEANLDYFPVRFRPEIAPSRFLGLDYTGDVTANPNKRPAVILPEWLNYDIRTGGRGKIDYVLIWQIREKAAGTRLASFLTLLNKRYELTYTSPRGYLTLYRLRE